MNQIPPLPNGDAGTQARALYQLVLLLCKEQQVSNGAAKFHAIRMDAVEKKADFSMLALNRINGHTGIMPDHKGLNGDHDRRYLQIAETGGQGEVTLAFADPLIIDSVTAFAFNVELTGNATVAAPLNPLPGRRIILWLKQDMVGARELIWNSVFQFSDDLPEPELTVTPGAVDGLGFIYNALDGVWRLSGQVKGY